jgi:MSHA biogenesis protein MshI
MKKFIPELELADVVEPACHFALASALVAARDEQ